MYTTDVFKGAGTTQIAAVERVRTRDEAMGEGEGYVSWRDNRTENSLSFHMSSRERSEGMVGAWNYI